MLQDVLPVEPEKGREGGYLLPRLIAQLLIHRRGIDYFPRIEDMLRVPAPLDSFEKVIVPLPDHLGDEFPPEPPVTMLPAQRTLVFLYQRGDLGGYGPEQMVAFLRFQVEDRAQVDLTAAGVRVVHGVQAIFFRISR